MPVKPPTTETELRAVPRAYGLSRTGETLQLAGRMLGAEGGGGLSELQRNELQIAWGKLLGDLDQYEKDMARAKLTADAGTKKAMLGLMGDIFDVRAAEAAGQAGITKEQVGLARAQAEEAATRVIKEGPVDVVSPNGEKLLSGLAGHFPGGGRVVRTADAQSAVVDALEKLPAAERPAFMAGLKQTYGVDTQALVLGQIQGDQPGGVSAPLSERARTLIDQGFAEDERREGVKAEAKAEFKKALATGYQMGLGRDPLIDAMLREVSGHLFDSKPVGAPEGTAPGLPSAATAAAAEAAPGEPRVSEVTTMHAEGGPGAAADALRERALSKIEDLERGDTPESQQIRQAVEASPLYEQWKQARSFTGPSVDPTETWRAFLQEKRTETGRSRALTRATKDVGILSGQAAAPPHRIAAAGLRQAGRSIFRPGVFREAAALTSGARGVEGKAPDVGEKEAGAVRREEAPAFRDVEDPTDPKYAYRQYEDGRVELIRSPQDPSVGLRNRKPVEKPEHVGAIEKVIGKWEESPEAKRAAEVERGEQAEAKRIEGLETAAHARTLARELGEGEPEKRERPFKEPRGLARLFRERPQVDVSGEAERQRREAEGPIVLEGRPRIRGEPSIEELPEAGEPGELSPRGRELLTRTVEYGGVLPRLEEREAGRFETEFTPPPPPSPRRRALEFKESLTEPVEEAMPAPTPEEQARRKKFLESLAAG